MRLRPPRATAKLPRLSSRAVQPCDLLLPVLPFAKVSQPILGVSILRAVAAKAGFSTSIRYHNLEFAERIGVELNRCITHFFGSGSLIGDWVFSEALYGSQASSADAYWHELRREYSQYEDGVSYGVHFGRGRTFSQYAEEELWPDIQRVRKQAVEAVEEWTADILAQRPRVVGFTSSGHQVCSTLAVARALKQHPEAPIVLFGGPNCHEELGLNWLHCFPWIDYVCTGEAEEVLPLFLRQVLRGEHSGPIAGMLSRWDLIPTVPPPIQDLDRSPIPEYGEYFRQLEASPSVASAADPVLPLETSRGCWWGERCQCVFCGDTQTGIRYRSKSPRRALGEVKVLARRYQVRYFDAVDDALDKSHIDSVFGKISKNRAKLRFIYQTRSDLTREQLSTLFRAGVTKIQPGIESFSDEVLRLMRKGTSGVRNVEFLRWAQEIGFQVSWRILYGFPGESVSEYERMAGLIPLLTHLAPPLGTVMIALKRFSPHWLNPQQFGLTDIRPCGAYSLVHPLAQEKLAGIATHFDFSYEDGRKPFEYTRPLRVEVGRWIDLWQNQNGDHPHLDLRRREGGVVIQDTRPCAVRRHHYLKGLTAKIYLACDQVQSLEALQRKFRHEAADCYILRILTDFVNSKLMIEDRGKYLSLALHSSRAIRRNRIRAGH